MNPEREDPLIEACLDEVLGGQTPPDLTVRILRAWEMRTAEAQTPSPAPATPGNGAPEVVPAWSGLAEPPIPTAALASSNLAASSQMALEPVPPPTAAEAASPRIRSRRRRRAPSWMPFVAAASVVLVGLALGLVAIRLSLNPPNNPGPMAGTGEQPGGSAVDPRALAVNPPEVSPEPENGNSLPVPGGGETPFEGLPDFTRPREPQPEPSAIARRPQRRTDAVVLASISGDLQRQWEAQRVRPAPAADDTEWCRRLFLRTLGRIPAPEELESFLKLPASERRTALLEQLLGEPYADEFARYWAGLLTNQFIGNRGGEGSLANREGLIDYLRQALREGKPYDQLTRELLTATGSPQPGSAQYNGATNFLLALHDGENIQATSRVAQVFLGRRLQCAQCHDDPATELSQRRFWTFNASFRQLHVERPRGGEGVLLTDRDFFGEGRTASPDEAELYYEEPGGEMRAAYPEFVDGTPLSRGGRVEEVNRRLELAEQVTASADFSRALVNRIWAHYLGYGFTRPIDDLGPHNPPSHPRLLDGLAEEFIARDFDLKQLIGLIAGSEAFALSGQVGSENRLDMPEYGVPPLFARYYTRPAQGEELADTLRLAASDALSGRVDGFLHANRSILGQVGPQGEYRPQPLIAVDSRFAAHGGVAGHDLEKLAANEKLSYEQQVEHLFLASLSRRPEREELALARRLHDSAGQNTAVALQAVWWALLNSEEFRTQP